MTPATLKRVVKTWQKRLKIEHIKLEINLDAGPEEEEALASVTPSDLYDYAELKFRADWPTHDAWELNRIVVHELLHVMFRDYSAAARSISMVGLSSDARSMWYDRCHDAEEGLVDRLAHRLVELGGVVE